MKVKAKSTFLRPDLLDQDEDLEVGKTYNTSDVRVIIAGKSTIIVFKLKEIKNNKILNWWSDCHFELDKKQLDKLIKDVEVEKI